MDEKPKVKEPEYYCKRCPWVNKVDANTLLCPFGKCIMTVTIKEKDEKGT